MLIPFFAQAQVASAQAQTPVAAREDETFLRGVAAFEARDFTTALRLFQDAYIATRRPDVLRNVAVTFERLDRPDDAAGAYERYLATATEVPDRDSLQQHVAGLHAEAARRATAAASPPPPVTVVSVSSSSPPPVASPAPASGPVAVPPREVPVGALVVIAGGALVLGASGVFYGLRADALSGCTDVAMQYVCPTDASFQHAQSAPTWNALTNVALIAGPVLLAGGAAWLTVALLRPRAAPPPTVHAWMSPSNGGVAFGAAGSF